MFRWLEPQKDPTLMMYIICTDVLDEHEMFVGFQCVFWMKKKNKNESIEISF